MDVDWSVTNTQLHYLSISIYLTILVGHLLSHVTETNDGDKIEEITDNFPTINVNKEVGSRIYNCWSAILFTHFLVIN